MFDPNIIQNDFFYGYKGSISKGPAWSEPQDPMHNEYDCLLYVLLVRSVQSFGRDADEVLKLLTAFYVQDTLIQDLQILAADTKIHENILYTHTQSPLDFEFPRHHLHYIHAIVPTKAT
jgi:hypothetical protein